MEGLDPTQLAHMLQLREYFGETCNSEGFMAGEKENLETTIAHHQDMGGSRVYTHYAKGKRNCQVSQNS